MRTPAYPAGQEGGGLLAASQLPPLSSTISYRRIPVHHLRALPVHINPRVQVLDYRQTTAPGIKSSIKPRTHGHGSARIAGFLLSLCLVREDSGWFLETEARCYDEQAARREAIIWDDALLAALYRAVEQKYLAGEARAYGSGAGRN